MTLMIDPDKGSIKKVFLIYYQYISLPCYFSSNTDWVFDPQEAELFVNEETAKYQIERLVEHEIKTLERLAIRPESLMIESRYMLVSDCLWIEC